MLQSFHLGFQFLSHPSVTCKVEGSDLGLTGQQLKFQRFQTQSNTKSPLEDPTKFLTWEANILHSFLTLPSLLANTSSCLPQAHRQFLSTVWLKGLHCTQREGQGQCSPARPQPVVGEAEGCQRQAQEAAAVQGVHLPIRDTTGLPTRLSPKIYTPKGKTRKASTNSNRLFIHGQLLLYMSWCISPDWNLWNASQLEGREEHSKTSKEEDNRSVPKRFKHKPADSTGYPWGPVAERRAAQAHSLLPSPMKVLLTAVIHLRC